MAAVWVCHSCKDFGKKMYPNALPGSFAACEIQDAIGTKELIPKRCPYDGSPAKWKMKV